MKITIITATYNSAATIRRSIESVISQNYGEVEHILVDGGSTDGTMDIVREYAGHFSHIISEPDNGVYDALNKGIALSTGDIIGFLNSDDEYASDQILGRIGQTFEQEEADVVYGDIVFQSKNTGRDVRVWTSKPFKPAYLRHGWMPPHPTIYCRREVYDRVGGFDTRFRISADYDFILRLFSTKGLKFVYLPLTMVNMTMGGMSNGSLRQIMRNTREDLITLRKNHVGGLGTLFLKKTRKLGQFFKQR